MSAARQTQTPAYLNPDLPAEQRAEDLVARMTLAEKVSQMLHAAPAIPRLGLPKYDWWNECLHGVGRAGVATVFPQAISLAATWDVPLMSRVATAISDEARAKHHDALRHENRERYFGLTFWTPNINIFRDPRWGRGQETYGEDPYLAARLGVAFVKALQGDDPRYLKCVATPKHYAVHSGPEADRHQFDARVSQRDLRDTYLPAFRACVKEGGAVSVMGAYNRTNGEPCCASPTLLQKTLREEWGFEGYVVSDCGAIGDIFRHHKVAVSAEEAAAMAVQAGCDLSCGETFSALVNAVCKGLIDEAAINRSVKRLFSARFRLGMFDPPERVPWAQIPFSANDSPEHRALALVAARESIVLLKNDGFLPLGANIGTIAVIGPNADDPQVLLGNYEGTPSSSVTPLAGLRARYPGDGRVRYAKGCEHRGGSTAGFAEAVCCARKAGVAIAFMGLSPTFEGEEGPDIGDRDSIGLPGAQEDLLRAVAATGTPLVVILIGGSAIAANWADEHARAVLAAWYPGEEGGTAVADVLVGDYNPAGRLPVTFYRSAADLPPFDDYAMAGRTYRYFAGRPLYPFGHGLSYTTFAYRNLRVEPASARPGDEVRVSVEIENAGRVAGDEVAQLYLSFPSATVPAPLRRLAGFERVHLLPGERRTVAFALAAEHLALVAEDGTRMIEPGAVRVAVGGTQPTGDDAADAARGILSAALTITGARTELPW